MSNAFLDRPSRSVGNIRQRLHGLLLTACAALTFLATPAFAQQEPAASPTLVQVPSNPDFMLGRPRATIGIPGIWHMGSAGRDLER